MKLPNERTLVWRHDAGKTDLGARRLVEFSQAGVEIVMVAWAGSWLITSRGHWKSFKMDCTQGDPDQLPGWNLFEKASYVDWRQNE